MSGEQVDPEELARIRAVVDDADSFFEGEIRHALARLMVAYDQAIVERDAALQERDRLQTRNASARKGGRPKSLSPDQEQQAVAIYRGGRTIREIAAAMGVSRKMIWRLVNEAGASRSKSEADKMREERKRLLREPPGEDEIRRSLRGEYDNP